MSSEQDAAAEVATAQDQGEEQQDLPVGHPPQATARTERLGENQYVAGGTGVAHPGRWPGGALYSARSHSESAHLGFNEHQELPGWPHSVAPGDARQAAHSASRTDTNNQSTALAARSKERVQKRVQSKASLVTRRDARHAEARVSHEEQQTHTQRGT